MGKKLEKDALQILQNLMGTPLADVIMVMESGEFFPPPETVVKEGEVSIGELTVFEKAIITVRDRLALEANHIAETNDKMVNEARAVGVAINKVKVLENKLAHRKASVSIEAIDNLFLSSVLSRLGKDITPNHSIGIREGYQIVRFPVKEICLDVLHLMEVSMG